MQWPSTLPLERCGDGDRLDWGRPLSPRRGTGLRPFRGVGLGLGLKLPLRLGLRCFGVKGLTSTGWGWGCCFGVSRIKNGTSLLGATPTGDRWSSSPTPAAKSLSVCQQGSGPSSEAYPDPWRVGAKYRLEYAMAPAGGSPARRSNLAMVWALAAPNTAQVGEVALSSLMENSCGAKRYPHSDSNR